MPERNLLPIPAAAAALLALVTAALPAQTSKNLDLKAAFKARGGAQDLVLALGGTAPAVVAAHATGVSVLDPSDPKGFKETAFFPAPKTSWRSLALFGRYAYAASEAEAGLRIYDLADPSRPKFVKTWTAGLWRWAHALAVDTGAKTLWVAGTDRGLLVFDLARDPTNPQLLFAYKDAWVRRVLPHAGVAELAEPLAARWTRLDATVPAHPKVLARVRTPLGFPATFALDGPTHLLVGEDPFGSGGAALYDLSRPTAPRLLVKSTTGLPVRAAVTDAGIAHAGFGGELRILDLDRNLATLGWLAGAGTSLEALGVEPESGRIFAADLRLGVLAFQSAADRRFYGRGTPGYEDLVPALDRRGAAYPGGALQLTIRDAVPRGPLFLLLGSKAASLPIRELLVLVNPSAAVFLPAGAADPRGSAALTLAPPAGLRAPRTPLFLQILVFDKLGSAGFAASKGLRFELFTP